MNILLLAHRLFCHLHELPNAHRPLAHAHRGAGPRGTSPRAALFAAALSIGCGLGWAPPAAADWHLSQSNGGGGTINDIKFVQSNPRAVYTAMAFGGVYRSLNGGLSWQRKWSVPEDYWVNALAVHPTHLKTLYAGTRSHGIYKTTDGGNNWVRIYAGGPGTTEITALAVNPLAPNTVFAGTWGGGVLKSQNAGATWKKVNTGLGDLTVQALSLGITSATPKTLYVATWGGGIYKTVDGGASWTPLNYGFPSGVDSKWMYDLAAAPSAPNTLYAGSADGMYKSTNGGASWKTVDMYEGYYSIAVHPNNPNVVYAGSIWNGAYKTTNGGATWNAINAGMPPSSPHNSNHQYETYDPPFSLAIDPASPSVVFAGTIGSGVYVRRGRPSVPTGVSVQVVDSRFIVSFSPPASNGGAAITSYTVKPYLYVDSGYVDSGLPAVSGAGSPIALTGLPPRTFYGFAVAATNAVGEGPPSAPVNGILTVPAMPSAVSATRGDGQATVTFAVPPSDGGSPITGYWVTTPLIRGVAASGTGSPIVVRGLVNGTQYSFRVSAVNAIGNGRASAYSAPVTPVGVPDAPTAVTATAGNGRATVRFAPPAFDGGDPIVSYRVLPSPGRTYTTGTGNEIVVTGLTNGTAYTFTVVAVNGVGTGPASAPSAPVTPLPPTVPSPPTQVTAVAGNGQATVSFLQPESDGGSPVLSYWVVGGRVSATGTASPIAVGGLVNGTTYTFVVRAMNAVGSSDASAPSNPVTPSARILGLGTGE
jgi:photosystem II stability/assembly factor-like uncharacterized protein